MPRIDANTVIWKEANAIVTILFLASGNFFELNKVGSDIWKLLAEGHTEEGIVEKMLQTYAVSKEKLASDVKAFIALMISNGLLQA